MTREHLTRILLFFYLLLSLIGSLWLMAVLRSGTLDGVVFLGVNISIVKTYLYCALAGVVGGATYVIRLFHDHYHQVEKHWFFWYIIRPFLCGSTAAMTIILFKSGIMLLQITDSLDAKIGISFLVGYGFGKFIEKLKALTVTLFDGQKEKEPPSKKTGDNGN